MIDFDAAIDQADEQYLVETERLPKRFWSEWEDDFLKANYTHMSDAELGQALDRTRYAVMVRRIRELRLPGRSKVDGVVTSAAAGALIGLCPKKIHWWALCGLIPYIYHSNVNGGIMLFDRTVFERWVINPMNWIYFNPDAVPDARLRKFCRVRKKHWGDEWWIVAQAAEHYGVNRKAITHLMMKGRFETARQRDYTSGPQYSNRKWKIWYVRRSEVLARRYNDVSLATGTRLSPAAIEWVYQARARGMSWRAIAESMKLPIGGEALKFRIWRLEHRNSEGS